MGVLNAVFSEVVAILAYVLLFAGVYKLFQIATELGEIKQLLKDRTHSVPSPQRTSMELAPFATSQSSDDAADYAAKLLRAVSAESNSPVTPESR